MFEGLGMDPNPSFFLPLFFVTHNSTNLSSIAYITVLSLSKLPPTSDNLDVQVRLNTVVKRYLLRTDTRQTSGLDI